jgi:hypothetical protein
MLKPSSSRSNVSQLDNQHSVFQSAKKVLVTSIKTLDIQRWVLRWAAQSLTVVHKTERKATSSELLAFFDAEGETFLSQTVTSDDTWVHNFHRRQKSNQ